MNKEKSKRILSRGVVHFEHGGAGVVLSKGLEKLGVLSIVLGTRPHPFGFEADAIIKEKELTEFENFDILHSHSEFSINKKARKIYKGRFVQHYHNSMLERTSRNPRLYNDSMDFVSTPNLLKVIPGATWVPLPVDTSRFQPSILQKEYISIGYHGPTLDKRKKPFQVEVEVRKAADQLRRMGYDVLLQPMPTDMPHWKIWRKYWVGIDIWVDRFGLDFYGFSAVEAASCGIPVICQVGDLEKKMIPDCPFITTTKDLIPQEICDINFFDEKLREEHRRYAQVVHDHVNVAGLCIDRYKELLE